MNQQKPSSDPNDALQVPNPEMASSNVPVFNCIVYVASTAGRVSARVANLGGIQVDAGSEREALTQIVRAFKQRVETLTAQQEPIPWIDPPDAVQAGEQQRFIPVHL